MREAGRWCAVLISVALAACSSKDGGKSDEDLENLVVATEEKPAPIDVDRAATKIAELERALAMPHQEVGDHLGPHRFSGTSRLEVREDGEVIEELTDKAEMLFDSEGGFAATLDNSKDYGRHVRFVGGSLYIRPKYGDYHKRPPEREDEPATIRDEMYKTVAAYLDLVARRAEVTDKGATTVAGRPARTIAIQMAPEPRKAKGTRPTQQKWREDATVLDVSGEVALDAETGVPLKASVTGAVSYVREGRTFKMTVQAEHEIRDIGVTAKASPPEEEDTVEIERRHSELAERDELLEGIAPPARSAPTPTNPEGQVRPDEE